MKVIGVLLDRMNILRRLPRGLLYGLSIVCIAGTVLPLLALAFFMACAVYPILLVDQMILFLFISVGWISAVCAALALPALLCATWVNKAWNERSVVCGLLSGLLQTIVMAMLIYKHVHRPPPRDAATEARRIERLESQGRDVGAQIRRYRDTVRRAQEALPARN